MIKDSFLFQILVIIRHKRSVGGLISAGLDYSQVADLLTKAIESGYIIAKDENLILSELGNEKLSELSRKNFQYTIRPLEKSRIQPIDRYEVYLPSHEELEFL